MKRLLLLFSLLSLLILSGCGSLRNFWVEEKQTSNIREYQEIFAEEGYHPNDLFPKEVLSSADVEEFEFYYYNPFDPNYLSYLVYTCNDEEYASEVERLSKLASSENHLIYEATEFTYPVLAVYADDYSGYTYVLGDDSSNRLIYVELYYCNYFSDIDYEKYIKNEHLPIGFNAKPKNNTRLQFENGEL